MYHGSPPQVGRKPCCDKNVRHSYSRHARHAIGIRWPLMSPLLFVFACTLRRMGFVSTKELTPKNVYLVWTSGIRGYCHTRASRQKPARLPAHHYDHRPFLFTRTSNVIEAYPLGAYHSSIIETMGLQAWTAKDTNLRHWKKFTFKFSQSVVRQLLEILMCSTLLTALRPIGPWNDATGLWQPRSTSMWMTTGRTGTCTLL